MNNTPSMKAILLLGLLLFENLSFGQILNIDREHGSDSTQKSFYGLIDLSFLQINNVGISWNLHSKQN